MKKPTAEASSTPVDLDPEAVFLKFEQAWQATASPDLDRWLAMVPGPDRRSVLAELVRLDMEFRFAAEQPVELEFYLSRYPELPADPEMWSGVAFEHFRLVRAAGGNPDPDRYRQRYGVQVGQWPSLDSVSVPSLRSRHSTARDGQGRTTVDGDAGGADGFPAVPGRFLDFELVGVLGQGAFARVYLARESHLARRFVALKVTRQADDEPAHLAMLQHTNIVPVFSLHRQGGLQAICMPFLGSLTLADWIKAVPVGSLDRHRSGGRELISTIAGHRESTIREGDLKANRQAKPVAVPDAPRFQALGNRNLEESAAWLFGQLAAGLGYAHGQGILHGDIKPANILISDDGHPLLLDFNLARPERGGARFVGGTIPYMAPEQVRGLESGTPGDHRSDLFSLGVVIHELLTGQRPAAAGQKNGTLPEKGPDASSNQFASLGSSVYQSLRSIRPRLDPDLCSILDRCLSPAAQERYQSAGELETDLALRAANLPLKFAWNRSIPHRFRKWRRRHPRVTSTASVGSLAAIVLAVLATLVWARGNRLEAIAAAEDSREFRHRLSQVQLPLAELQAPVSRLADAAGETRRWLEQHGAGAPDQLMQQPRYRHLDADEQLAERESARVAHVLLSRAENRIRQAAAGGTAIAGRAATDGSPTPDDSGWETAGAGEAGSTPDWRILATNLFAEGKLTEAKELLQKQTAADPADYGAWLLLGNAMAGLGQPVEAEACYGVCLALDPAAEMAWFNRANVRRETGDLAGAIADYSRSIALRPEEPAGYANRGQLRLRSEDPAGAEADFSRALDLGAVDSRVWHYRAAAREQLGQGEAAAEDREKFLELVPMDAEGWVLRGFVHQQQGNLEQALADYGEAARANPADRVALQNRANILAEQQGNPEAAIAELNRILTATPQDPTTLATRGVLWARMGKRPEALADAGSALAIDRSGDTMYRVAGIYAQTSKVEPEDRTQAVALLAAALLQDPGLVQRYLEIDPDLQPLFEAVEFRQFRKILEQLQGLAGGQPGLSGPETEGGN